MLFSSHEFIFLFLPITLLVFFQIGGRGYHKIALGWLVAASLFFYGWWNPVYLSLICFSMLLNYGIGLALTKHFTLKISQKLLLTIGVSINLALLGYFKYANFFLDTVNGLLSTSFTLNKIILPLAISFFTFQQIAYLVDAYRGQTQEYSFLNYCLFISFFPQLIAGPIVHHKEVMPQFADEAIYRFKLENLAVGLTIFSLGLFKKVVFADGIATYSDLVFNTAAQGTSLTMFEAWLGAFAFYLQVYFDFSGYSDMAIGAARLFGVKLPLNFNSPYKAENISQLWSRWHITLTHFLRDYLSRPLNHLLGHLSVGTRRQAQQLQRSINIIITMLLCGLWHGAGWNYVIWGGVHGVFLVIYQLWQELRRALGQDLTQSNWWSRGLGWFITMLAFVTAGVLFRAETMNHGLDILQTMLGFKGMGVSFDSLMPHLDVQIYYLIPSQVLLLVIVWFMPNTQQWLGQYNPALNYFVIKSPSGWQGELWQKLQWKPNQLFAIVSASITSIAVLYLYQEVEFIYFQF